MSIPVREWRSYLKELTAPQRMPTRELSAEERLPRMYAQEVVSEEQASRDLDDSEVLVEAQIMPSVPVLALEQLLMFIATDKSPQMHSRLSAAAKKAAVTGINSPKLSLSRIAFALAYMYTFCSGLWLERLAARATRPEEEQAGAFATHVADMLFAIESDSVEYPNCLVSIKRPQAMPHLLVLTFFQISKGRFEYDSDPSASTRLRVTRFVFDMRVGSADDKQPKALNAYLFVPPIGVASPTAYETEYQVAPESASAGDTYYELVRLLFSLYRGDQAIPQTAAEITAVDLQTSRGMAREVPAGAWFCLTLEWLAFPAAREQLLQKGFLLASVKLALEEIAPRAGNRDTQDKVEAGLRLYARHAIQTALLDHDVSSALLYAWATMLVETFWLPLSRVELSVLREPLDYISRLVYFDSPVEISVAPLADIGPRNGGGDAASSSLPATQPYTPAPNSAPYTPLRTDNPSTPFTPAAAVASPAEVEDPYGRLAAAEDEPMRPFKPTADDIAAIRRMLKEQEEADEIVESELSQGSDVDEDIVESVVASEPAQQSAGKRLLQLAMVGARPLTPSESEGLWPLSPSESSESVNPPSKFMRSKAQPLS